MHVQHWHQGVNPSRDVIFNACSVALSDTFLASILSMSALPSSDRDQFVGLALAALGAALFATKGIFVKLAYAQGLDALTTLT